MKAVLVILKYIFGAICDQSTQFSLTKMMRLSEIIRGRRLQRATEITANDLSDEENSREVGREQNLRTLVDLCNRHSPQRTPTQSVSPKNGSGLHILIGHSPLTKRSKLAGRESFKRLRSAPRRDMDCSILDLNDECLREIFRYLDLLDLVSVANVCTRFREIIEKNDEHLKEWRHSNSDDLPESIWNAEHWRILWYCTEKK